jgi:hypothetical protein
VFPRDMVCLRNISVDTLHKGDIDDIIIIIIIIITTKLTPLTDAPITGYLSLPRVYSHQFSNKISFEFLIPLMLTNIMYSRLCGLELTQRVQAVSHTAFKYRGP